MRIRGILVAIAAILTATVPVTVPAYAGASSQPSSPQAVRPDPQRLILPGGLRVKPGNGRLTPHSMPNAPNITDYGWVYIVNYSQDTFAITDNQNNTGGRLANHLYMWTNNGWSTQKWELLYDSSNYTYIFKSLYDGHDGGVAHGCINVPRVSTDPGTQLIVYSCSGYPQNERFHAGNGCNGYCKILRLYYDDSLAIDIGNNFPGNGAWVITYGYNANNWEEQWYWY